jgi:hypothetical protein
VGGEACSGAERGCDCPTAEASTQHIMTMPQFSSTHSYCKTDPMCRWYNFLPFLPVRWLVLLTYIIRPCDSQ